MAKVAKRPITMAEITNIAPTDKSIPAVRMTIVCAIAMMPVTVTCFRIKDRVPADMKLLAIRPKPKTLTIKIINGIAVGFAPKNRRALATNVLSSLSKLATFLSASLSLASKSEMVFVGAELSLINPSYCSPVSCASY